MSMQGRNVRFRSDEKGERSLKSSSGFVSAVGGTVGAIDAVREIRVLHRGQHRSKFFVVLERPTVSNVQLVVQTMVQLEEAFADEHFDYDTIGMESVVLIPKDAASIPLA